MKALAVLVPAAGLTLVVAGCSLEPGGPQYAELGLRTLDNGGLEMHRDCVPLPVLPGGRVEEDLDLAPGLGALVTTMDDSAEVALVGTTDPVTGHVTVPKASLVTGYSKILPVTTTSGVTYSVVLSSPCVPPADGGT